MYTIILYIFNFVVSAVLAAKSLHAYRRTPSNFIAKWFIVIATVNGLAYLGLVLHIYTGLAEPTRLSVLFDAAAVALFYMGMIAGVALSGELSDRRNLSIVIRIILLFAGVYVVGSTLQIDVIPLSNQNGIIVYPGSATTSWSLVNLAFSLSILLAYLWTSFIFIGAGLRRPKMRTKLFLLGGGFLASTLTGAALGFVQTVTHYLIFYSLFFLSYVVIFLGVIEKSEE